jgi:hypothetical protein
LLPLGGAQVTTTLLPSGSKQPTTNGPEFGAAFSAAGAAVSDARHFCDRQPGACEVGSAVPTASYATVAATL